LQQSTTYGKAAAVQQRAIASTEDVKPAHYATPESQSLQRPTMDSASIRQVLSVLESL
jgi:hypothetical protein